MSAGGRAAPVPAGRFAILAMVAMLFTAFAASYLVRRTAPDWRPVPLPAFVWAGVGLLAGASAALESARRGAGPRAVAFAALLGISFLAVQIQAWRSLAAQGVFLSTNPHASFFFMLSGIHGLHAIGGLAALGVALRRPAATASCAAYWHALGGIWAAMLGMMTWL